MAYDHGAFRVTNMEKSIEFYTQKLGFELEFTNVTEEYGEGGDFLFEDVRIAGKAPENMRFGS